MICKLVFPFFFLFWVYVIFNVGVIVMEWFWSSPEYLHFKCVILLLLYKCIVHLVISRIIVSYKFPLNAKEIKPLKVICGCRFSFLLHIDRGVAWVRSMSSCSTSILLPLQVLGRQCVQDLLGVCNVRLKKIVWHWHFLCNPWWWQCANL